MEETKIESTNYVTVEGSPTLGLWKPPKVCKKRTTKHCPMCRLVYSPLYELVVTNNVDWNFMSLYINQEDRQEPINFNVRFCIACGHVEIYSDPEALKGVPDA